MRRDKHRLNQPVRILIVDDEVEITTMLVRWFQRQGYDAFGLTGGAGLPDWVRTHACDVVVLDLLLPDANGLSLIRQITERSPSTKVIVLTALDDPHLAAQAVAEGASHYVAKPVDPVALQRIVEESLK